MGNLTRNPEMRYTPAGSAVCEFGIAVNRRFVQANGAEKEEVCFIDIVVWGKQAESTSRYLQKGSSVFIEGRLVYDQWEEKETQKKRSRLRVNAERVQFLDRRDDRNGPGAPMPEFPDAAPQQVGGYQQYRNNGPRQGGQEYGARPQYRQQQPQGNPQGSQQAPRPSYDEAPPADDVQYMPVDGVEDDIPF